MWWNKKKVGPANSVILLFCRLSARFVLSDTALVMWRHASAYARTHALTFFRAYSNYGTVGILNSVPRYSAADFLYVWLTLISRRKNSVEFSWPLWQVHGSRPWISVWCMLTSRPLDSAELFRDVPRKTPSDPHQLRFVLQYITVL